MSGITINTVFDNPNLPVSGSFKEQVVAITSLNSWFQAEAKYCDLSGSNIIKFIDLSGKGGTLTALDATKPELVPGMASGYSSAIFNGTSPRRMIKNTNMDVTKALSVFALVKPTLNGQAQAFISQFKSPSARLLLTLNTDNTFDVNFSNKKFKYTPNGEYFLVALSFDGVNKLTAYSSLDGVFRDEIVAPWSSSEALVVGSLSNASTSQPVIDGGGIADIMLFDSDILNSQHRDTVLNYFNTVYSL